MEPEKQKSGRRSREHGNACLAGIQILSPHPSSPPTNQSASRLQSVLFRAPLTQHYFGMECSGLFQPIWAHKVIQKIVEKITHFSRASKCWGIFLTSINYLIYANFRSYFWLKDINPLPSSDAVQQQKKLFYRICSVQYYQNSKNITSLETGYLII